MERAATYQSTNRHTRQTSFLQAPLDEPQLSPEYTDIYGFIPSQTRYILAVLLCFLSFGMFPLLCVWRPQWWTITSRQPVRAFRDALIVLVNGPDGYFRELRVHQALHDPSIRYFVYRKQRYVYDESFASFKVNELM